MLSVSICSRKAVTGSQGCGRVWRLLTLGWLNFKCTAQQNFLEPEVCSRGLLASSGECLQSRKPRFRLLKRTPNHTLLSIKTPNAFWFSLHKEWLAAWSEPIPVFCTPPDVCSRDFI